MNIKEQTYNIDRIIEDISYIKQMVTRNNPVLHEAGISRGMQIVSLAGGLGIILFCSIFHWLTLYFGSFSSIPSSIKLTLFIISGIAWVFLGFYKQRSILSTARTTNPELTIGKLIRDIYNVHIIHSYLPPALLMIGLTIYFGISGNIQFIVPTVSLGMGIVTLGASVNFRISEMLIMGYWLFFSGIGALIFNQIPATISLSYTLGFGFIIFSIIAYFSNRKRSSRGI